MSTKHTCNGPTFGRLTPGCPRCDELAAGAAPHTLAVRTFRLRRAQSDKAQPPGWYFRLLDTTLNLWTDRPCGPYLTRHCARHAGLRTLKGE